MTALSVSTNRAAAETVCRHASSVADARRLLEMLGLVDEGGHELVPDVVIQVAAAVQDSGCAPVIARERPSPRDLVPEGLRNLPPAPPEPRRRRSRSLTEELEELELTDPDVAEAAAGYDRMVWRLTSKPLPKPDKDPAMPVTPAPARPTPEVRLDDAAAATLPTSMYVAALSVVELFVDPTYQRPLDEPRVKRMTAAWDPRMVGILDVSDRGPSVCPRYAVINGQHRWRAAGRAGVQYVACNVHEGLTVADEARLMYELDRTTKKLSGWDKWRARRGAGDQAVLQVDAVAARHGLQVTDDPAAGSMRSYGTAEKLLALGGEQLLDSALGVLRAAWGDTSSAFQAPLLMGVGQLLYRHRTIDIPRLGRALAGTRPEQIRQTATALREVDGGPLHELVTRAVVGQYNRLPGQRLAAR